MGGTKIMVFHLREIIRTVIFAIIGIIAIIVLVYLFLPRNKPVQERNAAVYLPGTYISQITLKKEPVNVEVKVSDKEIISIELKNMAETQEVFYPLVKPAMERLAAEIVESQNLNVHISSEDSVTSSVLLQAIKDALNQAEAPKA